MFIARVEILHQRRSEERNPTRPSARKHISAPPNAAGGVCSSSYKHATPNGGKTRNAFFHTFGSGWVLLALSLSSKSERRTHPLPHGGTDDLMGPQLQ